MKVFNSQNTTKYSNSIGVNIHTEPICSSTAILFENSMAVLGDISCKSRVLAHFDLYVIGDLEATRVEVKRNLYVFGSVKAQELITNGEVTCFGSVDCYRLQVQRDVRCENLSIRDGKINGDLNVEQMIDVKTDLQVSQKVLCMGGLAGPGCLNTPILIYQDYCDLNLGSSVRTFPLKTSPTDWWVPKSLFSLEGLSIYGRQKKELSKAVNLQYKEFMEQIVDKDADEIANLLRQSAKYIAPVRKASRIYDGILKFAMKHRLDSVESYLELLELKKDATDELILRLPFVVDVLDGLVKETSTHIDNLVVIHKERGSLFKTLYRLEKVSDLLSEIEYQILSNTLTRYLLETLQEI